MKKIIITLIMAFLGFALQAQIVEHYCQPTGYVDYNYFALLKGEFYTSNGALLMRNQISTFTAGTESNPPQTALQRYAMTYNNNYLDKIQALYLLKEKPASCYSYIYHDIGGGYTTYRSFNLTFSSGSNKSQDVRNTLNDFNAYVYILPLYKIHSISQRFMKVGDDLTLHLAEAYNVPSGFSYPETDPEEKKLVEYYVQVKIEATGTYKDISLNGMYAPDFSVSYNTIKSALNPDEFTGKRCFVRLKFKTGNHVFYSNEVSFYYLPPLGISKFTRTQPTCPGGKGTISAEVSNLPAIASDSISYLYLIYNYTKEKSTADTTLDRKDSTIIYNNDTLYFKTAFKSDDAVFTSTLNISDIKEGIYKFKVYCTFKNKNIHYYPAESIFDISSPPVLVNNSSIVCNWSNQYQKPTGSDYTYLKLSAAGGNNSYSYSINGASYLPFSSNQIVKVDNPGTNLKVDVLWNASCPIASKTFSIAAAPEKAISIDSRYSPSCNTLNGGEHSNGKVYYTLGGGIKGYRVECIEDGATNGLSVLVTKIRNALNTIITDTYSSNNKDNLISTCFSSGIINNEGLIKTYCLNIWNDPGSPGAVKDSAFKLTQYLDQLSGFTFAQNTGQYGNVTLKKGNYKIYLTDATLGSVVSSDAFEIADPPLLAITFSNLVQPRCFGNKGQVDINIKNYLLADIDSIYLKKSGVKYFAPKTTIINNLDANSTYTVVARTNKGCYSDTILTIKAAPDRITYRTDSVKSSCRQAENGRIIVDNFSGGVSFKQGYKLKIGTKLLNHKSFTHSIDTLSGLYTVTVVDSLSCESESNPVKIDTLANTIVLVDPSPALLLCSTKRNGEIALTVNPGDRQASTYKYSLTGKRDTVISSTTFTFKGLSKGNYTARVTGSDGCVRERSAFVRVRTDSLRWIATDPVLTRNTACSGISTGEIDAQIVSGYSAGNNYYELTQGGKDSTITSNLSTATFKKLPASAGYRLTVRNDSSCAISKSNISVSANPNPVHFKNVRIFPQHCDEIENGNIRLKTFTQTGYYISRINDITGPLPRNISANDSAWLENLKAGTYKVLAIDNVGCQKDTSIQVVNIKNVPRIKVSIIDSLACANASNGIIKVTASQPVSTGNFDFQCGTELKKDSVIAHFFNRNYHPAGNPYHLSVSDKVGCTFDTSFVFIPIKNPVKILSFNFDSASCIRAENAGIRLDAGGSLPGNPGYYFVLNLKDTVKYPNKSYSGRKVGGSNKIILYDKFGCKDDQLPTFAFPVKHDTIYILDGRKVNPACPDELTGSIQVSTKNGNPLNNEFNYRIFRNNNSTPFKTLSGLPSQTIENLPEGNFLIEVTDKDNCRAYTSEFVLSDPDTINFKVFPGYVATKSASTGWINSEATGGNGKYQVEWYAHGIVTPTNKLLAETTILKSEIKDLAAGQYLVRVRDTASCKFWDTEWLEKVVSVPEPDKALALSATKSQVSCNGLSDGIFTLEGTGGWGTVYRYGKSPSQINQESPVFGNLSYGSYTFFVKDTSGTVSSINLEMTEPDPLTASMDKIDHTKCYGASDGKVTLLIKGGNKKYQISKDNANWIEGTMYPGLSKGNYTFYVHDSLNCATRISAQVNQPDKIIAADTTIFNTQCQVKEGSVETRIEGGTPGYFYQWSDNTGNNYKGSEKIDSLYSGQYLLKVTDANDCPAEFTFYVSDVTDLEIDTIVSKPVSCWKASDGGASVIVGKGFPPYSITWPGDVKGSSVSGLSSGNYLLKIIDSEGCKVFQGFSISSPDSLWLDINRLSHPLCYGVADGLLDVSANGGTPSYNYSWNTGKNRANISNLDSGLYSVLVTDKNNCRKSFKYHLTYQEKIKSFLPKELRICKANSYPVKAGKFSAYTWKKDGAKLSDDSVLFVSTPGKYLLQFQDFRGCISTDSIRIIQTENALKAQFLMASAIRQNDTLIVFEASDPLPDSIVVLPAAGLKEIKSEKFYKYFVAKDTGKFDLTMISYSQGCQDIITKQVLVLPPGTNLNNSKPDKSKILKFNVYPNPTDGNFQVDVQMIEKADIYLRLVSFGSGKTEAIRNLKGDQNYLESFYMEHLQPGFYLLNLQVGDEMRNIKLIIR